MSLFTELKRRNVFRVTAAYLALCWVITQVTGAVVPALHLPGSIPSIVVWLSVIGLPFVILFSWVYELTPEGEEALALWVEYMEQQAQKLMSFIKAYRKTAKR